MATIQTVDLVRVERARPKHAFDRFHLALKESNQMLCGVPIQSGDTIHHDTSTLWRDDPHICAQCRFRWKDGETQPSPQVGAWHDYARAVAPRLRAQMARAEGNPYVLPE